MRKLVESGSVMLDPPMWFFDDSTNTTVIILISINSSSIMGLTGIGTVQMLLGEVNYTRMDLSPNPTAYILYTPDKSSAGPDYSLALENSFTPPLGFTEVANSAPTKKDQMPFRLGPTLGPPILVIKKYDVIIQSI